MNNKNKEIPQISIKSRLINLVIEDKLKSRDVPRILRDIEKRKNRPGGNKISEKKLTPEKMTVVVDPSIRHWFEQDELDAYNK